VGAPENTQGTLIGEQIAMDTWTGSRAIPFNGSPGIAPTPEGEVAFVIAQDNVRLANYRDLSNYKVIARQKSENSPTSKTGITLENFSGTNVQRVFEGVQGQETYDLTMRNIRYTGIERNVISGRSVYGGLLEDCYGNGGEHIGTEFQIAYFFEQAADVILRRCGGDNFYGYDAQGRPYGNGDIFSIEGNALRMVLDACYGSNPKGDSVFDIKGGSTFKGHTVASLAHRLFRCWDAGIIAVDDCLMELISPKGQDFWANAKDKVQGDPTLVDLSEIYLHGAVDLTPIGTGAGQIATRGDTGQAAFRSENGWTRYRLRKPYRIQERAGFKLTWGNVILETVGGWYTAASGITDWYDGAPPTGAGGVLL
jgi:hypothetical protein